MVTAVTYSYKQPRHVRKWNYVIVDLRKPKKRQQNKIKLCLQMTKYLSCTMSK